MATTTMHSISGEQMDKILREARTSLSSEHFDLYACLSLISELGQSVDDAIAFASIFVLASTGDDLSMSEGVLELAMTKHGVTVDEIIEFDDTLDNLEFESEKLANRDAYLAARCRKVSHELAVRHVFYP